MCVLTDAIKCCLTLIDVSCFVNKDSVVSTNFLNFLECLSKSLLDANASRESMTFDSPFDDSSFGGGYFLYCPEITKRNVKCANILDEKSGNTIRPRRQKETGCTLYGRRFVWTWESVYSRLGGDHQQRGRQAIREENITRNDTIRI